MTVPRYVRAYWRWVSDFDSINYCSISRVTHLRTQREQRYTLELAIYDNRFRPRPTFPRCIYSVLKVILRPNRGSVKLRCRKIMENRFFFFLFPFTVLDRSRPGVVSIRSFANAFAKIVEASEQFFNNTIRRNEKEKEDKFHILLQLTVRCAIIW